MNPYRPVQIFTILTVICTLSPTYVRGETLTPFIWPEVIAVWKSEADLESALSLSRDAAENSLDPYVACWAAAGSDAREVSPPAKDGLIHIEIDSGESSGCRGIALREEYLPEGDFPVSQQ
jgi:hypothetical protein